MLQSTPAILTNTDHVSVVTVARELSSSKKLAKKVKSWPMTYQILTVLFLVLAQTL